MGLRPATPQYDAGIRMLPPVSVPTAAKHRPAATAATEPPLLPPDVRERSQGLFVCPKSGWTMP